MADGSPNVFSDELNKSGWTKSRVEKFYKREFAVSNRPEKEIVAEQKQDALLLCLAEIAQAESVRQQEARDQQGWQYLSEFLKKWFSGSSSLSREQNKPAFVDWSWLLQYQRVVVAVGQLSDLTYLFNEKAKQQLASILHRDGFVQSSGRNFDYINGGHKLYVPGYFQQQVVSKEKPIDGLTASLGAFVVAALPQGRIEPVLSGGYQITISSVALVVIDSFDFEDDSWWNLFMSQPLGRWDCESKQFGAGQEVSNKSFRNFRGRHKKGGDFRVYTQPQLLENWQEFVYNV